MERIRPYLAGATLAGAAVLCLAATAAASGWAVVASYPAPAPNARGVAFNAPYGLSVLCDGSPPRVYNVFRPSEYVALAVPTGARGLTRWREWGDDLVVSNYNTSYIYRLTTTGSLISSFRCPRDHPADLSGGIYDKYVAVPGENLALEITTTGSVVSSFKGPGTRLTGIQSDGGRVVVGDPQTHKVYFLGWGSANVTSPVAVEASIGTGGPPPYALIMVVDAATNYIYYFDWVGPEPVTPASLGRVRALYE
jgi:hypothetical protein